MNAKDMHDPERRNFRAAEEFERVIAAGFDPTEVDLRNYYTNNKALKNDLQKFDVIWVVGGNCFVLRKAFYLSGFDTVLPELLRADAVVYAGYSAGTCVVTPTLRGIDLCDDISLGEQYFPEVPIIWDGLGLIPYAVAPHYKSDHPESAMIDRVVTYFEHNHIPYKPLRDNEVLLADATSSDLEHLH